MQSKFGRLLWLGVLLVVGAAGRLAAQPALSGPEILFDPTGPGRGIDSPIVATEATGNVVEIAAGLARVFDSSGRPLASVPVLASGIEPLFVIPDRPEGFLLAWVAEREGAPRYFIRRLDPLGRPRGAAIEVADSELPFPFLSIAVAADGSFVAAWNRKDRPYEHYDVYLRCFDSAGRPRGAARRLPREGGGPSRFDPMPIALADGDTLISWWSPKRPQALPDRWVRRFDRDFSPRGAAVEILAVDSDLQGSDAAFTPEGEVLVVSETYSEPEKLRLRGFDAAGRPFAEREIEVAERFILRLAAEPGGTFLLAWTGAESSCAVQGVQLRADGSTIGPEGCLTQPASGDSRENLVVAGNDLGGFQLFWKEAKRTGENEFYRRLFSQRLGAVGPGTLRIERPRTAALENAAAPDEIRVVRRDGSTGTVSVGYRLTGAVSGSGTITFPDGDSRPRVVPIPHSDDAIPGNDRIVRVTLGRPTGGATLGRPSRGVLEIRDDDAPSPLLSRPGPPVVLASGDRDLSFGSPALAAAANGEVEVAWDYSFREAGGLLFGLQRKRFGPRGGLASDVTDRFDRPVGFAKVAMHPAGDFALFYSEFSQPRWVPRGFVESFDARGAAVGERFSLGATIESAAAFAGDRFVGVGSAPRGAADGLYAYLFAGGGAGLRSPVLVSRAERPYRSVVSMAADRSGRFVVVWPAARTASEPAGIYARRFSASGDPLGPPFRVSQEEYYDRLPSASADAAGNFVIAWERHSDGDGPGVYARRFDASGAPLGDEFPVNGETAGYQGQPSVAMTGDGRFLIAWTAPGALRGQLFERTGIRRGAEAELSADTSGDTPQTVWSDRGFFAVVYLSGDLTYGQDIFLRRLPL